MTVVSAETAVEFGSRSRTPSTRGCEAGAVGRPDGLARSEAGAIRGRVVCSHETCVPATPP
jgi:hypothetical protein